jgi:hypothetical protein
MKVFLFEAWIHPKRGGDDYACQVEVKAETQEKAEEELKKWLRKRSAIDNDYNLITTKDVES